MKSFKNAVTGITLISAVLVLAGPASAAWRGTDLSRDRREIADARHELHYDLRRGAGPHEIARHRAAIARERRDIWRDRHNWRHDHSRDDHGYRPWWNGR